MTSNLASVGAISYMDFAGTVEAIHSNAQTPTSIVIRDRVCAAAQGIHFLTPRVRALVDHLEVIEFVSMKSPEQPSSEGVTLGSVIRIIRIIELALFPSLGIPGNSSRPAIESKEVLVDGGSTFKGTMAIQLLPGP